MGIQINGQTDTISATDGSLNIAGTVAVNVTGDATGLTGTPNITVGVVTASSAVISGDLTVQGTTTTLDTLLTEVDKLEVGANNTNVAVAITQSGSGDILRLYDGATQAVTVKDGGSVGIGTDNPNNTLVISKPNNHGITLKREGVIYPGNVTFNVNSFGAAALSAENSIEYTAGSSGSHKFFNLSNELVRIDTTGNVGIGTDNPANTLHVQGVARFNNSFNNFNFVISADSGNPFVFVEQNAPLLLGTNSTERLRITSNGLVGINTTVMDANLEVHTSASKINAQTIKTSAGAGGYAGLAFMAGQTSAGREKAALYFQETNNGAHYTGDLVFALNNDSGSAVQVSTSDERMRITSGGNVGIGTDNPIKKVDIRASAVTAARLQVSSGGYNWIELASDDNSGNLSVSVNDRSGGDGTGSFGINQYDVNGSYARTPIVVSSTGNIQVEGDITSSSRSFQNSQSGGPSGSIWHEKVFQINTASSPNTRYLHIAAPAGSESIRVSGTVEIIQFGELGGQNSGNGMNYYRAAFMCFRYSGPGCYSAVLDNNVEAGGNTGTGVTGVNTSLTDDEIIYTINSNWYGSIVCKVSWAGSIGGLNGLQISLDSTSTSVF